MEVITLPSPIATDLQLASAVCLRITQASPVTTGMALASHTCAALTLQSAIDLEDTTE